MQFVEPSFLFAAAAASILCIACMIAAGRARKKALRQLGARHLIAGLTASLSSGRRHAKQAMIVAGVALFLVAFARPQLGYRWEEVHRHGVDLLFAVDTSKSMLTGDVKPSRLERAKLAVHDLVERFPGDRVGLIAFAGRAFLETPLTLDHGIFEQSLDDLDTSVIPVGGTDVASAIEAASKALSDDQHKKVLVLLTDGEDLQGDALAAAEKAGKEGLTIDTVGVGTPRGELIPLPPSKGQPQFVRDPDGNLVTSHLDEALLRRIAQTTGGTYRPLGDSGAGLESLYQESLSALPQSDLSARSQRVPIERYQWPLGMSLLLLGLEPLVGERRRRLGRTGHSRTATPGHGPLVGAAGAAAFGLLLCSGTASASPQSAERAYQAGHYDQAEADYAKAQKATPDDARLSFDLGDAEYRKGDFDGAAKAFETSVRSSDLKLQTQAYYNLGNARYRIGESALGRKDIDATRKQWNQSISRYEGALALEPGDKEARDNLEFVKRRLAELDKQQDSKKQEDSKKQQSSSAQNGKSGQNDKNGQNDNKNVQNDNKSGQNDNKNGQNDNKNGQNDKGQSHDGDKQNDKGAQNGPNAQTQQRGDQHGEDSKTTPQQPGQGEPKSAAPQDEDPSASETARSAPGELSKQEAKALLDSLRGDLLVTTPAPLAPKTAPADAAPRKDW